MRINECVNLNKYIICWPSLLDEAIYPDLIYLAVRCSAVKWDKKNPFTLFTTSQGWLLTQLWFRVSQTSSSKHHFSCVVGSAFPRATAAAMFKLLSSASRELVIWVLPHRNGNPPTPQGVSSVARTWHVHLTTFTYHGWEVAHFPLP